MKGSTVCGSEYQERTFTDLAAVWLNKCPTCVLADLGLLAMGGRNHRILLPGI